jgi:hypothetical protein
MTDFNEAFGAAIAASLEGLHTALPGRIQSVSGPRVSVKPLVNRQLRDGRVDDMAVIPNVPLWFPQGGGTSITWPVAVGDQCLIVFCERSIDGWKESGGVSVTEDPRHHAEVDCFALCGIGADLAASGDGIQIVGNVTITGSLDVNGASLQHNGTNVGDDHMHGGIEVGPDVTGVPI